MLDVNNRTANETVPRKRLLRSLMYAFVVRTFSNILFILTKGILFMCLFTYM